MRDSAKRDWYIWRDGPRSGHEGRPNNWKAAFGGDAWTYDDTTAQWYLHLFLPEQPDVNWDNRGLAEAMYDVLRFWLDRGVDGFRIDVVQGLGKDPDLADDPPGALLPHCAVNDRPEPIASVLSAQPGLGPLTVGWPLSAHAFVPPTTE